MSGSMKPLYPSEILGPSGPKSSSRQAVVPPGGLTLGLTQPTVQWRSSPANDRHQSILLGTIWKHGKSAHRPLFAAGSSR